MPDGEPVILLDGFGTHANAHNMANGFAWGPDGWLYNTHGRSNWSLLGKPGTPEKDRARILVALEAVDFVCLFDEENPARLIRQVMPDVLVKGGDYMPDKIVGFEEVTMNGGRVEVIPLLEGYSRTGLIQKIKEQP